MKWIFQKILVLSIIGLLIGAYFLSNISTTLKADLSPNLVGYWSFNDDNGSIAYDSSGNGNHGFIHGCSWSDGISGNALYFDGVDDNVHVSDSPSLDLAESYTLSAWIKRQGPGSGFPDQGETVISKHYTHWNRSYALQLLGKKEYTHFFDENDDQYEIQGSTIVNDSEWYHVAVTYSYSTGILSLYLNGVLDNSVSVGQHKIMQTSVPVLIGAFCLSFDGDITRWHFNGSIDEVKIYNRALGEHEISAQYEQYAFQGSTMGLISSQNTVIFGEEFNITVYIDPEEEIGGWEIFKLNFTQGLVHAQEVKPGSSWSTNFDNGTIDNDIGLITDIQAWRTGGYPDSNHTACTIHCTAVQSGVCDFVLSHVTVVNAEFEPIDVATHSIKIHIVTKPEIRNEYPFNESIGSGCGVDGYRAPLNLSVYVEDLDGDSLNITFYWCPSTYCYGMSGVESCPPYDYGLIEVASFVGVGNGRYGFIPNESSTMWWNDWLWGDTSYLWAVQVTDGTFWMNRTYWYHTGGSRYDVTNDCLVNFIDAGKTWIHRDSITCYDGLYDVDNDCQVNFIDAGLTWVHRD